MPVAVEICYELLAVMFLELHVWPDLYPDVLNQILGNQLITINNKGTGVFSQVLCLLKAIISSLLVLPCKCSLEFFFYSVLGTLKVEFSLGYSRLGLVFPDPQTLITVQVASGMLCGLG